MPPPDRYRSIVQAHSPIQKDTAERRSAAENVARGWLGEPAPASQARAETLRHRHPHHKTDRRAGTGIAVAHGYGLKVRVENRHLTVDDGFGRQRRTRRFHRTDRLRRLVLIGRSGYVTLDALRWLHDTGAAFLHVDASGELVACSVAPSVDLAGLRRAQALAPAGPAGLEVARRVLALKVEGQLEVLDGLPDGTQVEARRPVEWALSEIKTAGDLDALLWAESQAAAGYWQAWAALPARFPSREAAKLPEHWRTFGQRASLITGGPRTATNPANAIVNYLYALLEAETILACYAVGLDPGLGIFHTDRRDRASLALDLMEAARPAVDAYLLALLTQRTLSAREFVETREGACRITPRLAEQLAETCAVWRAHVAPVVEWTANTLARHASSRVPVRSPLTRTHHRAALDERLPDRRQRASRSDFAVLPNTCRECGAPLTDRRRRYCDKCRAHRFAAQAPAARQRAGEVLARLRAEQHDPAHGGRAAELRGAKNAAHQVAVRQWTGERPEPDVFRVEILPGLRRATIAELVAATGLSEHYCSLIRLGKMTPHPRHWEALRSITTVGPTIRACVVRASMGHGRGARHSAQPTAARVSYSGDPLQEQPTF
jgi:CRISPR-associated endonuclease Cas1